MKNTFKYIYGFLLLVGFSMLVVACSSDDNDPVEPGDRTILNTLLAECQDISKNLSEYDYPKGNIDLFSSLVKDATEAAEDESLTQNQINSIVLHLENGKKTLKSSAYDGIPEQALVMHLDFESGDPEQLITSGSRQLIAKLVSGPVEIFQSGTSKPTYVEGVGGGKAIHFTNGSHLEISDYNPNDFLGNTMSISTWLKPDESRDGNYIASLNYWENWKLEIEKNGKPFFTLKTTEGVLDADNEKNGSVTPKEWAHVVITIDLTKGELAFYVDGNQTIVWKAQGDKSKPQLAGAIPAAYQSSIGTQLPFMLGAATTYEEAKANWSWTGWDKPAGWSYYMGAMDNFSIYNVALTKGQVGKLYKEESSKK